MSISTAALFAFVSILAVQAVGPQHVPVDPAPIAHDCGVDLALVGHMEDILSNALTLGLGFDESRVRPYLTQTRPSCADGPQLLAKAATDLALDPAKLTAEVERYRHVNCGVTSILDEGKEQALTPFALDVTVHVVLHELGHALIREFDLPVLGNEETMADAFATHYVTAHMPDLALDVLRARVLSLESEASEVPPAEWSVAGEHDSDARRARQIAALAVAADPTKYRPIADLVGLSESDIRSAADYGTEIHRSWRRILGPLWMPQGLASHEAALEFQGQGRTLDELRASGLPSDLETILRRFDWHSRVELRLVDGDGGAGWSRSERAITVHTDYMQRFVAQGAKLIGAK